MDSTRWQRVQSLFHEAADMPASEQRGYLETRCGDDAALVSEVWSCWRKTRAGDRCWTATWRSREHRF